MVRELIEWVGGIGFFNSWLLIGVTLILLVIVMNLDPRQHAQRR